MKRNAITVNTFFLKNEKKKEKIRSIENSKFAGIYILPIFHFFFIKRELKTMKKNM